MAAKKKVKEVSGVYNPFWTRGSVDLFRDSNIRNLNASYTATVMEYNNSNYLPFYSLPAFSSRAIGNVYYSLRGTSKEIPPMFVRQMVHPSQVKIKKFFTELWNSEKYWQFFNLMDIRNSSSSNDYKLFKNILKSQFDETTRVRADVSLRFPSYSAVTGALNIVNQARIGGYWGVGQINTKSEDRIWRRPLYLYNKYFLAYLYNLTDNGQPVFHHGGTQYETQWVPIPLMSLMFKTEHYQLITGYMMNDKEIPAELMELWVDKSLDEVSSLHPIRTQYMRTIKKPLEASGVEIKVFDNLDKEMYARMTVPKFRSMTQQKDWVSSSVNSVLDIERNTYGIITKKEDFDKTLETILASTNKEEFSDIMF